MNLILQRIIIDSIKMESDWVDLLVELPEKVILYEVKSDGYAVDCMLQGIGQALGYAYRIQQLYKKTVELVISGSNDQSDSELEIMEFIKA